MRGKIVARLLRQQQMLVKLRGCDGALGKADIVVAAADADEQLLQIELDQLVAAPRGGGLFTEIDQRGIVFKILIRLLRLVHQRLEALLLALVQQQNLFFQPVHGFAFAAERHHHHVTCADRLERMKLIRAVKRQLAGL